MFTSKPVLWLLAIAVTLRTTWSDTLELKFMLPDGESEREVVSVQLSSEEDNRNTMRTVLNKLRAELLSTFKKSKNKKDKSGTQTHIAF